jgi:ubiquinone/menaquinone biosynthesis C-methylase UbiE
MDPRILLDTPALYNLKSAAISLGRNSVGRYLRDAVQIPKGGRVLDVGCGPGRHARTFDALYFGVDSNPEYIAYAKKHRAGTFCVMDASRLAFPDSYFDLVFCVGLLHHLPDDVARTSAREMRRVLKKDGTAYIIEAVSPDSRNIIGSFLFKHDRGAYLRNLQTLKDLLSKEGFEIDNANLPGSAPYVRAAFAFHKG